MRIEGFDVTYLSSYDGLPVKNHLPVELRERFKTENQWLESGYVLVAGAVGLEMHPTAVSRTLCTYYPMRRKTPCFSYGDIRRVHRIYASN